MKLDIQRRDDLPKLSWCMRIERGSSRADVICGPWVETREDWFVEGAWDKTFEEGVFEQSCLLMGSGGKSTKDELVLATPCHNLEPLYYVCHRDRLFASNSLAFLLVESGLNLDLNYPYYSVDLVSSRLGLERYVKSIPTASGPRIQIRHYLNLHVDRTLTVIERPKPRVPDWHSFRKYYQFLVEALRALKDNANAPGRSVRYELLSTISSGYDSAAAAALSTEVGGRDAITIMSGGNEDTREEVTDDATEIAKELDLNLTTFALMDQREVPDQMRAEFAACGDSADVNFITFGECLAGKLLTTGHSGTFWMDDLRPSAKLARIDVGGSTQNEFRLRLGYVHVPVPMLGAIRRPRLFEISRSREMKPWSVAKTYNRPIPRRILEEKGIPRDRFARQKIGGLLAATIPVDLWIFFKRHRSRRKLLARVEHWIRFRTMVLGVYILRKARTLGFVPHTRIDSWDIPRLGPRRMVVQWGQSIVQERYRS